MSAEIYNEFAADWIDSWNSHNLERIMFHYSDEVEFYSPVMQQMGVNEAGRITAKANLKDYFEKALQKYYDLNFQLLYLLGRC